MKQQEDYGMSTTFQVMKGDKVIHTQIRDSCFRGALGYISSGEATHVKYYPWFQPVCDDHERVRDLYLETLWKLPFFRDAVVEHTGFNTRNKHTAVRRKEDLEGMDYFLVDVQSPRNRGFTVLQILRNIQESPGRLRVYELCLEKTGNEFAAFVASLAFTSEHSSVQCNGHSPINNMDIQWAMDFVQNPENVNYADEVRSNLLGGNTVTQLDFESFCRVISSGRKLIHKVAVYGTLRAGHGNHRLIKAGLDSGGALSLGLHREKMYAKMCDTGCGFPAVVPSKTKHMIVCEKYLVDDEVFANLDLLEGYPHHYNRKQVMLGGDNCWIYFYEQDKGLKTIPHGDWRLYGGRA